MYSERLRGKGWILFPAYDINPNETGTGLKLNINENDNSLNLELAMEVHKYFRLTKKKAEQIMNEVKETVKIWKTIAAKYGISKAEQELNPLPFQEH